MTILEHLARAAQERRRFVDEESFVMAVEALLVAAGKLKNYEGKFLPRMLHPEQAERFVLAILMAEHA